MLGRNLSVATLPASKQHGFPTAWVRSKADSQSMLRSGRRRSRRISSTAREPTCTLPISALMRSTACARRRSSRYRLTACAINDNMETPFTVVHTIDADSRRGQPPC